MFFVIFLLTFYTSLSTANVPATSQVTAPPIRTATAEATTNPEPFMENGPPASATSGQNYLRANTPLDGTDAYIGRHTALEQLGPLGEHNTQNAVQTPEGDLGRQDMLQWIYGSKEAEQASAPITPVEDANYLPEKLTPMMKPSTVQETGAWFTDSSNIKIDNNAEGLEPITSEPASTTSPPPPASLPDPIKGDQGDPKSFGAFDTFGQEDNPTLEDEQHPSELPTA